MNKTWRDIRPVRFQIALGAILGLCVAHGAIAQSTAPLLQKADLVYEGAFRVPTGGGSSTFEYGGRAIAYNPANNSLFLVGQPTTQPTAEITIPELVISTSRSSLKTASFLQNFSDATEGKRNSINPGDPNPQDIGGQLVYNGRLVVSAFSTYDGAGTQRYSHFSRPLTLSSRGESVGPVAVGGNVHYTSAYMTQIPGEWRSAFGGPALTGNCCRSIISVHSRGPAVSVFDPANVMAGGNVSASSLVLYTASGQLGPGEQTQNPYYNLATRVTGIAFPSGTRSVLFFGEHGIGKYCYGEGSACGDPADQYKGNHAYPYKYQVWAYDANDLVKVKNGQKSASSVQPYAVWTFDLPFISDSDHHEIGGVAYDEASGRIYVSQVRGDGTLPIVHAFKVQANPVPYPMPPGQFQIR